MENRQDIIEDLLKDLQVTDSVQVTLPSENRGYSFLENEEPVSLRPLTYEDEKALVSSSKAGNDAISTLISRCVDGVIVEELYDFDKLFLLLKLREISYGDDYKSLIICPLCKAENPVTVLLSELSVNPVPDDFSDPCEVFLKGIKKTIRLRYPRTKDEKFLADSEKTYDNLWRFVVDIEGVTDKVIITEVLKRLPLIDHKTILNSLKLPYGVETKVNFQCSKCGGGSVINLPINENFFNVS